MRKILIQKLFNIIHYYRSNIALLVVTGSLVSALFASGLVFVFRPTTDDLENDMCIATEWLTKALELPSSHEKFVCLCDTLKWFKHIVMMPSLKQTVMHPRKFSWADQLFSPSLKLYENALRTVKNRDAEKPLIDKILRQSDAMYDEFSDRTCKECNTDLALLSEWWSHKMHELAKSFSASLTVKKNTNESAQINRPGTDESGNQQATVSNTNSAQNTSDSTTSYDPSSKKFFDGGDQSYSYDSDSDFDDNAYGQHSYERPASYGGYSHDHDFEYQYPEYQPGHFNRVNDHNHSVHPQKNQSTNEGSSHNSNSSDKTNYSHRSPSSSSTPSSSSNSPFSRSNIEQKVRDKKEQLQVEHEEEDAELERRIQLAGAQQAEKQKAVWRKLLCTEDE